jgi:hypothetical protein
MSSMIALTVRPTKPSAPTFPTGMFVSPVTLRTWFFISLLLIHVTSDGGCTEHLIIPT